MTNSALLAPAGSEFFVFRDKDGRLRAYSWKRWCTSSDKIIAWAHTLKDAKAIIAELNRKQSELPLQ